jgi:DNA uptake protein ComE-like DNA-binding protein
MTRVVPAFAALALLGCLALPAAGVGRAFAAPLAAEKTPLVDLNSASKAALVKLPGVSESIADRIIAGRPWSSKYDLVVKKVVSRGTYDKFARWVVARQ